MKLNSSYYTSKKTSFVRSVSSAFATGSCMLDIAKNQTLDTFTAKFEPSVVILRDLEYQIEHTMRDAQVILPMDPGMTRPQLAASSCYSDKRASSGAFSIAALLQRPKVNAPLPTAPKSTHHLQNGVIANDSLYDTQQRDIRQQQFLRAELRRKLDAAATESLRAHKFPLLQQEWQIRLESTLQDEKIKTEQHIQALQTIGKPSDGIIAGNSINSSQMQTKASNCQGSNGSCSYC
ncbi:hypothetical protein BKA62DRAFT_58866 [Auriculariales sp. MPI-PUGE-AT-0066]|nr:hypothetical protein BKA62DRAFT_58866 [Auriculariales sp. MPI-PUGE-AT-0066]